jgi:hypothetical protein
MLMAMGVMPLM